MKKILLTLVILVPGLMGCAPSLLQCGVDGDSSYVTVNADKKLITVGGRNMAELCAFNTPEQPNAT